ncbi:hypothetical protein [Paenibacillus sp. IHBB 3054]|uniref:hypothetical protein n=1 Tax=Paenibacillus sp. IHBB 3054 TaxID=3425689 RepID=UPI003F681FC3
MVIVFAALLLIATLVAAYRVSSGKSRKRKLIIWGITLMVPVSPLASWMISLLYADFVAHDGFAGIALLLLLPLFFLAGLIVLLTGIFHKKETGTV